MIKDNPITDAKGKEIHVGDRVRFATWGMFGVWIKDKQNSGRKPSDPEYVTYVYIGTVEKLFDDDNGSLHVRPDRMSGVIRMCTRPSWGADPEFVEIID